MSIKGIAVILFGLIVAIGGTLELAICWFIGLLIGFLGLLMVLNDRKEDKTDKDS